LVLSQQGHDLGAERHRAPAAHRLGLADDPSDPLHPLAVLLNAHKAGFWVQVCPPWRLQLAGPAAGDQPKREEALPLQTLAR